MADQEPVRLFVSHHSSKAAVAQQVEALLAKRGIRCWIAPRDVPPGTPFDTAVHNAIENSAAVLLLFCSNSDKSRHVKRELILSDSAGRSIIPLRLEAIDPGELAYHLADSQWVDWIDRRESVMDRVAAQARLFAKVPAELAPDVTTLAATPAGAAEAGSKQKWLMAGLAGAVLAVLALVAFIVFRPTDAPTTGESVASGPMEQSEGPARPESGDADRAPAASEPAAAETVVTEAPRPAPPVIVARPLTPPAEPAPATPDRVVTQVAGGPLQRVVQACAGVPSDTEYLICSDPALARRAQEMSGLLRQIRARLATLQRSPRAFDAEQRQWFNAVRASCHTAQCVETRQRERLRALQATLATLS